MMAASISPKSAETFLVNASTAFVLADSTLHGALTPTSALSNESGAIVDGRHSALEADMGGKIFASLLAFLTVAFGAPASAALVDFYITGDGSGVLNTTDWSGAFTITMVGDNSTTAGDPPLSPLVIDPLARASVTISGVGTAILSIPTRLGLAGDTIFFSRSGAYGLDLFDFILSSADAAAFSFQAGYGPALGAGVSPLEQFVNVATSAGPLPFNTSSDVEFYSSGAAPELSTWTMMMLGFAGLGFAGYRARRAAVSIA